MSNLNFLYDLEHYINIHFNERRPNCLGFDLYVIRVEFIHRFSNSCVYYNCYKNGLWYDYYTQTVLT